MNTTRRAALFGLAVIATLSLAGAARAQSALAAQVAEQNGLPLEEARSRLNTMAANLQLFDRLDLAERSSPGRVGVVLRLQTAQPLKRQGDKVTR